MLCTVFMLGNLFSAGWVSVSILLVKFVAAFTLKDEFLACDWSMDTRSGCTSCGDRVPAAQKDLVVVTVWCVTGRKRTARHSYGCAGVLGVLARWLPHSCS